ncbi:hypothetical protein [Micromonospora auratinigra]|uniref:PknH-like extracellular domain-containing protein n=1 Tax=Micromonospora auratinigra TaxID=261654 RepID=A0A1A9A6Y1_9ACTN|nr:hypothetical protein [Micromonospora auratinigra]SBT51873.1 hypothetical protein GA0070611_5384 [Micromonospora auratinigra]
MRDQDLSFVELVRRDLQSVRWSEAAELRARARRRSRRRTVGAAAAVFVLLSGSAVAAAGLPGSGGRPAVGPAAYPPGRAEIPLDALLQAEDLAGGVSAPYTEAGLGEPIVLDPEWTRCLEARKVRPIWERSRYSRSQSVWALKSRELRLVQDVYRVDPGQAQSFAAGIDRRIRPCLDWQDVQSGPVLTGPTVGELAELAVNHRWEVVARNFAGDDAVLIRHTAGETRREGTGEVLAAPPMPQTVVVVRVEDLVTVFQLSGAGSDWQLERLAVAAARRLCVAANPGC